MALPGDGSTLSEAERKAISAEAKRAAAAAPPMSLDVQRRLAARCGLVLDADLTTHAS